MKVLLDNCVDRNFAPLVAGIEVAHARDYGWRDLENGKLLAAAAAAGFAAMITVDKNIRYQQNLAKLPIAVIELDAARSHIDELSRFAAYVGAAVEQSRQFAFVSIKSDGSIECVAERVAGD